MGLRAGELDRSLILQVKSAGAGSFGDEVESWSNWALTRGKVEFLDGTETFQVGQRVQRAEVQFTIRYRAGVSVDRHRVVWDGRLYDILSIAEPERRAKLVMKAYAHNVAAGP